MHSKSYLAIWLWATTLISTWAKWVRVRGSDMDPLDSPSKVLAQCANLMNSTLLVTAIHAFKVLLGPHIFALLGVTDLCLNQMGKMRSWGWHIALVTFDGLSDKPLSDPLSLYHLVQSDLLDSIIVVELIVTLRMFVQLVAVMLRRTQIVRLYWCI